MANQSYLDFEDELLDHESMPYDSLSNRTVPPDFTAEAIAQSQGPSRRPPIPDQMPMQMPPGMPDGPPKPPPGAMGVRGDLGPSVRDAIAQRMASAEPPAPLQRGGGRDPLLDFYKQEQKAEGQAQLGKSRADLINNLGQSFQQVAQGSNSARQSGLFDSLNKQSADQIRFNEKGSDRRQQLVNAIEGRKSREALAQGAQNNRQMAQDSTVNRTLGQVVARVNNDPIIRPSETNLASLGKSKAILENKDLPLTPQSLSDAEQDIASALTLRGMGATEGKIKRTEIETIGRKIAEFKQKWGNQPVDLRKEQPELVAQIGKLNQALIDDYQTTIKDRKNAVLDEYKAVYGDSPVYQARIDNLRDTFNKSAAASESKGSGMFMNSAMADGGKQIAKKQFSPSRNQTRITYSDGSTEVVDGQQ